MDELWESVAEKSEQEKLANRLIELGVFDCTEFEELKQTKVEVLKEELIDALEAELKRVSEISKKLYWEKQGVAI